MRIHWEGEARSRRGGGAKGAAVTAEGTILTARTARVGDGGTGVICSASEDGGRTWRDRGVIASDDDRATDIGDGCLLARANGELWYSYRRNRLHGKWAANPRFAIEVAASRDGGATWRPHSTVALARGAWRGLWSSFLLERRDGSVTCFYDDEDTPAARGFPRHQWVTAKTWDERRGVWGGAVTVSRAHDPAHLSRDGMPSVVEGADGRLFCALESVRTSAPHAGLVRWVESAGGAARDDWNWRRTERAVVHEAPRLGHSTFAPWVTRLTDAALICVFGTNAGREKPDAPGTPAHLLNLDIAYVLSEDDGRTWSREAVPLYAGSHRCYMPQVVTLGGNRLACLLLDFKAGFRVVLGSYR